MGFEALGVCLAEWWPYACCRWPVDTAVRSEQLTVCRVRYGSELYGKIIRIDDDPPTLFVGVPARTGQEGDRGYVGRAGLVGVSDLATDTVRPVGPLRGYLGHRERGKRPPGTQRPSNWIAHPWIGGLRIWRGFTRCDQRVMLNARRFGVVWQVAAAVCLAAMTVA